MGEPDRAREGGVALEAEPSGSLKGRDRRAEEISAVLRSPISRHPVASRMHLLAYSIHDLSSIAFLVALIGQVRSAPPWLAPALLATSVASGFWLIAHRRRKGTSAGHLTRTAVVTSVIGNQGMAIALLGWMHFFPRFLGSGVAALLSGGIALHSFYAIVRSSRLLFDDRRNRARSSETTVQLLYMIALPNLVFFGILASGLQCHAGSWWIEAFLIFECVPGLAFSLAHDRTWVWGARGLARWRRDAICLLPCLWLVYALLG